MSLPNTRQDFKEYCLRRLGKGAITINVTEAQCQDRIDEALVYWKDYHHQAKHRTFLKHQITQQEIDTKSIILPNSVTSVVKVFAPDHGISAGIFSLRYQLQLNDLYDLSSTTLSNYVIAQQYLSLIQNILTPESALTFQKYQHKIEFDSDIKEKFNVGSYLIIEAFVEIIELDYPDVWTDRALADMATSMIKRQWRI